MRSVLFPPPCPVLERGWVLIEDGILQEQIVASMRRILQGFLLGSAIGIPLGLAIGSFRPVRLLLEPWTEFFRFIPAVAMITVAVIWFGIGEESKIFLIAYTTVFVVIISTAAGVGAVGRDKIRAAQCLGATRLQVFALVALPATVPYILTGMRLAMANAFVTIVAAELVASQRRAGQDAVGCAAVHADRGHLRGPRLARPAGLRDRPCLPPADPRLRRALQPDHVTRENTNAPPSAFSPAVALPPPCRSGLAQGAPIRMTIATGVDPVLRALLRRAARAASSSATGST